MALNGSTILNVAQNYLSDRYQLEIKGTPRALRCFKKAKVL